MPAPDLIVSVDQGSSATKALLVGRDGAVLRQAAELVGCEFPQPGWVEQSAAEIADSVRTTIARVTDGVAPSRIAGVALSTQRESLALWDRDGRPAAPVITWQDQRTDDACARLTAAGLGPEVQAATGLPLDPMFSGAKATWLLDTHDPDRTRTRRGHLRMGTIDSWLIASLTQEHLTEVGNASRTQLLDLRERQWHPDMLKTFRVPESALPRVTASNGPFAGVRDVPGLLDGTPILAVLADSHAALFAHGGWEQGQVKATYGTGSSIMGVASLDDAIPNGLCTTIAWQDSGRAVYALEGNIRSSGSTLVWLARLVSQTPGQLAALAASVPDSLGVTLVPAFNGLAAPWWDSSAAGAISGLTLGTELAHVARAALESICMQVEDVVAAVAEATGPVEDILADGGASANDDLMQMQADLSGRRIGRSRQTDLSALGAAHFAGLQAGLWDDRGLAQLPRRRDVFSPTMPAVDRKQARDRWHDALGRARRVLTPQHAEQAKHRA